MIITFLVFNQSSHNPNSYRILSCIYIPALIANLFLNIGVKDKNYDKKNKFRNFVKFTTSDLYKKSYKNRILY